MTSAYSASNFVNISHPYSSNNGISNSQSLSETNVYFFSNSFLHFLKSYSSPLHTTENPSLSNGCIPFVLKSIMLNLANPTRQSSMVTILASSGPRSFKQASPFSKSLRSVFGSVETINPHIIFLPHMSKVKSSHSVLCNSYMGRRTAMSPRCHPDY